MLKHNFSNSDLEPRKFEKGGVRDAKKEEKLKIKKKKDCQLLCQEGNLNLK